MQSAKFQLNNFNWINWWVLNDVSSVTTISINSKFVWLYKYLSYSVQGKCVLGMFRINWSSDNSMFQSSNDLFYIENIQLYSKLSSQIDKVI